MNTTKFRKVLSKKYLNWVKTFAIEHTDFKVIAKTQNDTFISDEEHISYQDAKNILELKTLYTAIYNYYMKYNLKILQENIGDILISKLYINFEENVTCEFSKFILNDETYVDIKIVEYNKEAALIHSVCDMYIKKK